MIEVVVSIPEEMERVGNMRTSSGKLVHSFVCAAALFVLGLNGPNATAQLETNLPKEKTFCNPLNLDYTYKITESDKDISYRSGADPAVVDFRGDYYMFVTRALGYWYSKDLTQWSSSRRSAGIFRDPTRPPRTTTAINCSMSRAIRPAP